MTRQMGHVIDLMPTILDVAGARYPEEFKGKKIHKSDGKSLLPVLKGKIRQGHEALYWEHLGNRAIRQGKWKLVMDGELKSWELYDLEDDRTERKNLIEKYPKHAEQLRASWQKWAVDVHVFPKKLKLK
jgi:arylsulfatase